MADAPTIVVFNSGLGGLTVFREVAAARPDARFVYVADDAAFPYGEMPEEALITRILHVVGKAIAEHRPDLVVIACNTASTLVLAALAGAATACRSWAPCRRSSRRRNNSLGFHVSVLATAGTIRRDYTHGLIRAFAGHCDVQLVGSAGLAPG